MENTYKEELDNIITMFNHMLHGNNNKISREQVLIWMNSDDIEVNGAVYTFCTNSDYYANIEPYLTAEDYYQFIKVYFRRCLIENPSGEWTKNRYEAGWAVVVWFKSYWKDKSLPHYYVSELKDWLADIYKTGDDDIRRCIITAVLEHLFDNEDISTFFSDWQNELALKEAFEEAMDYAGRIKGP